jgi:hypothetical protein
MMMNLKLNVTTSASPTLKINSLSEFKNIHKGYRAIICGSGPSLNGFDFNKLTENDIVFAYGQAVTVLKHCHYFCMTDEAVPRMNFFEYGTDISDKIGLLGVAFNGHPRVLDLYEKINNKLFILDRRFNNSRSTDFNLNDGLLIVGVDGVHVTSHLAHIMGCSPIVLVGVDLKYDNGKMYCDGTEFKNKVHWSYTSRSNSPSGENDPEFVRSFDLWREIKQNNPNVKFLNANSKGRLVELFDSIIF